MEACARCGSELPPDARFCPSCAAAVEHVPDSPEERKVATILFADLVGSTALGGSQDPERTRAMLDRFYDGMAEEIEQAGGTVEKFVGDAVMAAFGAPAALEDHAERALHAALAMRRRLHALFGDRLALRIGVNTGEVVVGRPREGSSFVTGDAVNVGARLEQAAAPGEILVGERTAAAVRGAFELSAPVTVEAKGKPSGVAAQRLVRALSLMRPRGVGGLHAVFVGRDAEFARLREAYERVVADRRPQLIVIGGDAGVGKTRLVRELWQWLADQEPRPLARTGRCLSYGHGITYWPLAEVLREHFDLRDDDGADVALDRFGRFRHLGLTLGLDVAGGLHPLLARERLHDSWAEFLQELVAERPAVLLVEDVHWAEDDLLDLIESLVAQVDGPLLVIATARPELLERRPAWHRWALRLEALREAAAGDLLDGLIGSELPPDVRAAIVERAEGNPFFVEELLATLIDRGVLLRQNGGWAFTELPEGFEVPDSVQAVLAARIDLLPATEKSALQAAAVIGRVFWTGPVYELVGGSPDLDLLVERDFVRRRTASSLSGEREYAIKHALTREVAYASVPKARRARLHAGFARWLERTGDEVDAFSGLLAHHYAEAVRPEDLDLAWAGREDEAAEVRAKALEWSTRAAELAIGRYEIDDGLSLLQRALELEQEPSRQAALWEQVARGNALKFDGEAFWQAMETAIELGGPSAERYAELALQSAWRAGMWTREPDWTQVEGWATRARELAAEGSAPQAKALVVLSEIRGDATAAHEARAIATRRRDVELGSLAAMALANASWAAGDFEEALRWSEEELGLLEQVEDPDAIAKGLLGGVFLRLAAGRIADAREAAARHADVVAGLTPHHRMHGAGLPMVVETLSGRWAAVRELTLAGERAVKANLAARTPCPMNVAILLHGATASAQLGDEAEARRLETAAEAIAMEGYAGWVVPARIRLALARDDLGALRPLVEQGPAGIEPPAAFFDALAALRDRDRIEAEAPNWLSPGTYAEPFVLRALGVARADAELVQQAAAAFEAMGLDWHARRTREQQSSV